MNAHFNRLLRIHNRFHAPEDGGKGGGGGVGNKEVVSKVSDDQREALLATDGIGHKSGESAQKKKKDDKGDDDSDKGDDDKDDGGGLAKIVADAMEEEEDGGKKGDDDDGDDDDKSDDKKDKDKKIADKYDKDFPKVEDDKITSQVIKEKFKRANETRDKLVKELRERDKALAEREAKLKDVEEKLAKAPSSDKLDDNPEFKRLKEENTKQQEIVERLSLQDSPKFKKTYDEPLALKIKTVLPHIKAIKDTAKREQAANLLQAAINIPVGEDNDPTYYAAISEVVESSGLPTASQSIVLSKLQEARELVTSRHEALSNWQATKQELDIRETGARGDLAKSTVTVFKGVRKTYETTNAAKIEKWKKMEYDETIQPVLQEAEKEITSAVSTGVMSPKLLGIIHAGVESSFLMKQNGLLQKFAKDQLEENAKLKEKLAKFDRSDPDKDRKEGKKREEGDDKIKADDPKTYPKSSGILATMAEEE